MKHFFKVIFVFILTLIIPISSVAQANSLSNDQQKQFVNDRPVNRVILPNNNRHQIFNTTQGHYQSIAFVNIGNRSIASGVVIGKNTLLTNKHVVNSSNGNPSSLSFAPAASNENQYPYGVFKATDYKVSPTGEDLAIVHVSKNSKGQSIGDVVQPATFGDVSNISKGTNITVTGYPGDKPIATLWESRGKVINRSGNNISYDLSTYGGNSGSPVFNSSNQLIGLHYGGVENSHNSAVLFTNQMKQFIYENIK